MNWESHSKTSSVGFFDGEKLASIATRPVTESSWREWLGRVFQYGASVWRARNLPTGTMKKFDKFLDLAGIYEDVGQMLIASENLGSVATTAVERLRLNKKYIEEVLGPQLRRHTGQDVEELSDLALSMALEREEQGIQDSESGGRLLTSLDEFSIQSGAGLRLCTRVSGLKREMVDEEKDRWILQYEKKNASQEVDYEMFDKVILAAPLNTSSLMLPEPEEYLDQIQYRSRWITFLVSKKALNIEHFGGSTTLPSQILPMNSQKPPRNFFGIQDITYLKDVVRFDSMSRKYHSEYLYRILSQNSIDNSTIFQIFEDSEDDAISGFHQEKIENAYPLLYARNEEFPGFKLSNGLWHTSVIEAIGTSVDLSWIAGENVGRLVLREIEKERNSRAF